MVFPDGLSYRVLVLPEDTRLNLDVLRKVRDMVKEGIAVVGPKPQANPGLTQISRRAIPNCARSPRRSGAISTARPRPNGATARAGCSGDCPWRRCSKSSASNPIAPSLRAPATRPSTSSIAAWSDAEVYFVANRRRRAEDVVCTFRVKGKQPELWNPETGEITQSRSLRHAQRRELACRCNSARRNPCSWCFVLPPPRGISAPSPRTASRSRQPIPSRRSKPGNQRDVTNDFTVSVWIKPDLDSYQTAKGDKNADVPNRSLVISPPQGDTVYGSGHVSCGLSAGRNGVAVLERDARQLAHRAFDADADFRLGARGAGLQGGRSVGLRGWQAGRPVGGFRRRRPSRRPRCQRARRRGILRRRYERSGTFQGSARAKIASASWRRSASPGPIEPPAVEWPGGANSELLFWQDGSYTLARPRANQP